MKRKRNNHFIILLLFSGLFLLHACREHFIPKPRGYFRINLPEKAYILLDSIFPYSFEYPDFAAIEPDIYSPQEKYWINIEYSQFRGAIHLSYKEVHDDLSTFIEDSRNMAFKHVPKASAIEERVVVNEEEHVYGLVYNIRGTDAASPIQFYVTDSTTNFLRGALYFQVIPNNDSLAPVIAYIEKDIYQLLKTLRWKE